MGLRNGGLAEGLDQQDTSLGQRFVLIDLDLQRLEQGADLPAAFQAPSICPYGSPQDDGHGAEALC
jgi:hypothetical protein